MRSVPVLISYRERYLLRRENKRTLSQFSLREFLVQFAGHELTTPSLIIIIRGTVIEYRVNHGGKDSTGSLEF